LPLSLNSALEMKLIKGFEKLQTNPVTDALFIFGVPEDEIEKYWGFLNKRKADPMHLLIRTEEEVIWLEANGFSCNNELEFWEESGLFSKIEIHA